jgi:hypothetical protein
LIVAVDTSAIAAALNGERDRAVILARQAIIEHRARFAPVVIMELLSNPRLSEGAKRLIMMLPRLDLQEGIWERAGALRAQTLAGGRRANVADVLIAQSCIDHDIPLITYDRDFRHFVKAGLKLA